MPTFMSDLGASLLLSPLLVLLFEPEVAPVSLLVPDPHAASTRLLAETATATFIN